MVVNVAGEKRVKMSGEKTSKHSHLDGKKYSREAKNKQKHASKDYSSSEDSLAPKIKKFKSFKKPKEVISETNLHGESHSNPASASNSQPANTSGQVTQISASDLEELRSVYNKCKAVINKIETKYGHLLNVNDKNSTEERETCKCTANTKIIFDENGEQIVKETVLENHVCPKKIKRKYSDLFKTASEISNVQIEYETPKPLPDDLQVLTNMLHDSKIEVTYRNQIISKIRSIKQEYINEIRFNRPSLKEKLKAQPNEVLQFNGANLFNLPGYPDGKPSPQ